MDKAKDVPTGNEAPGNVRKDAQLVDLPTPLLKHPEPYHVTLQAQLVPARIQHSPAYRTGGPKA
ncbi:hypothetical protein LTR16_008159, partial [Cryomyces antarcticus]